MTPLTVAFHTLGCKLNFSETSALARLFVDHGYQPIPITQGADICVINTCSVTEQADRECRKIVRQLLRVHPESFVVVTGCYAQLKPSEIAEISGVDLVLGAGEKFRMLEYIDNLSKLPGKGLIYVGDVQSVNTFTSSFSFGDRTRSFLKVQDGCDYKCTFCTIPQARGKSRSDDIESVVQKVNQISALGIKEIVLTGVNIGDFGKRTGTREGYELKKEERFIDLITTLDSITGIDRYRISSIEPNLLTKEIIRFVASSQKFMPHFHLPLQSGNNKQLAAMKRRYTRELYSDRVELIKNIMPHASIGVDVITGFPGETEEDFLSTYNYLNELEISYLHVFTYSERANTPAAIMEGSVPIRERRNRTNALRGLSEMKRRSFYTTNTGCTRPTLFEKSKNGNLITGFTDNYIKIELPGHEELLNTIHTVRLERLSANGEVMIGCLR